jgi:glycosyltransferase involved in cell wall biosynthesis
MAQQIHQILPTLAFGDAIGNLVLELARLLREWGYESEIFAERWDPRLAGQCRPYEEYRRYSRPDNVLILHYSIGGASNEFAMGLPDRVILYYHNITPARYFYRTNGQTAHALEQALRALPKYSRLLAIADSPFNGQELESLGFRVIGVVPPLLSLGGLDASLESPAASVLRRRFGNRGTTDWLHVGRLAPNKCIHDIIKAFYYYSQWIDPKSRLLLVGTTDSLQAYVDELYHLVTKLRLDGKVVFTGHVESLGLFYQMSNLYISMSEHEGFCIPLVEAMCHDVPVVAYASTSVPSTLGGAGVLVHAKDYAAIAEMSHEIISNTVLRERLVRGQRERLVEFEPERTRARMRELIQSLF